jgi:hypothetical protein
MSRRGDAALPQRAVHPRRDREVRCGVRELPSFADTKATEAGSISEAVESWSTETLKFEFPIGMEHELNTHISHAMTKVPTQLRVPLGVEGKFGINFRDLQKFK